METKKIKQVIFLFLFAGMCSFNPANAQINVSVNISSQALWGPVGYDYVEYYYLPEEDVFYYVPTGEFIYFDNGKQFFVTSLPPSYTVNLYTTYKVVVNEPKPYLQHTTYITKYAKYKKGGYKQNVIRDSREEKYFVVKGHPKHGQEGEKANEGKSSQKNNQGERKTQEQQKKQSQPKAQKSEGRQKEQQQPQQQKQQKQSASQNGQGHGGKGHK
jgi:hypothetical protein